MTDITFITGNQNKADYLAKYLDLPIKHVKLDIDEIQTLDIDTLVEHKVRQAYAKLQTPVIVEDTSLSFEALNGLPGPFIKFFVENIPFQDICNLLNGKSRNATAKSAFGYFDGKTLKIIEGVMAGTIAQAPAGSNGWDWDQIFTPEGFDITRASMNDEDYQKTYLEIKPFEQLREFLENQ